MSRNEETLEGVHPLSPMQHGMLYQHLADRQSDADLVQVVCELRERLDFDRFRLAWSQLAARHAPFRTRLHWEGAASPVQEIVRRATLEPVVLDWRDRASGARDESLAAMLEEDRRQGMDLTVAPAMRLALVRWADDEWRCVWSWPHILYDGHSLSILLRELFDLYDGGGAAHDLPVVPRYSKFLEWLGNRSRNGDEGFFRELLDGVAAPTPLPGEAGGDSARSSGRGAREVRLTAAETSALAAFAESSGVSVNAAVQAAWAMLLSRYAAVDDPLFGVTRACRQGGIPDADRTVGLFINTLPVRVRYEPDATVADWVSEFRRQQLAMRAFEHTPLTDVQRWGGLPVGEPLFESIIVFNRASLDGSMHAMRPEWTHRRFWMEEPATFPLTLYVYGGEELEIKLAYDRDRLADDAVDRVLRSLLTLLREIPKDSNRALKDVPLLAEEDRRRQLLEWNATGLPFETGRCVHELVEAQVRRTPDSEAVSDGSVTLTFRVLDVRANRLAHRLQAIGVGPDRRVGVCLERTVDLVVAVLGVLKAGGAWVPLDPDYPSERLEYMARDAGLTALVTADGVASGLLAERLPVVDLVSDADALAQESAEAPASVVAPEHLAYVIYTSGSTGRPKGVMVEHRNVVSFFAAMDVRIPNGGPGVWLAVTSLAFDISVLELLWPLTRGFKVVVGSPVWTREPRASGRRGPEFSLFYFASGDGGTQADTYRLLAEGARFADRRGFHAIWTPERHFHAFGGLYPNPSVAAAALAGMTSKVRIRAGSVVLPLHHPLRIAEEWALVDNLSGGRVGISFASGWQPNDFVLAPHNYADRKRVMMEGIDLVRRLWRGESVELPGPDGKPVEVRTLPRPVQPTLPVWITTAGSPETYRAAGTAGANVLTHLLGQSVEDVAAMIAIYREAWKAAGHPGSGSVTLMLHTFVGDDDEAVREMVREPMKRYLRSSVSLIKGFAGSWTAHRQSAGESRVAGDEFERLSPDDMESLLDFAFERYFETSGLFGTPARCTALVDRLRAAGIDEIACLIDFGISTDEVLAHLEDLDSLRQQVGRAARASAAPDLAALMRNNGVTHLQCTPSLARMLLAEPGTREALGDLDVMLVGGEPLPGTLAAELRRTVQGTVINMYGPTETTVWSSTYEVRGDEPGVVPIGRPIANTRLHVLDAHAQPLPAGVPGELYIGGPGVVRGYLDRPELTSERFVPDPFSGKGERLYRTGDTVRWRADGVVEFLGRVDHQVKIRGHRIELGEIEAVLASHPDVGEVVVNPVQRDDGDAVLVAYVVPADGRGPTDSALRAHAGARLPDAMVPSQVVMLTALPLTPNGKVDRNALPIPGRDMGTGADANGADDRSPTALEALIADVWRKVLGAERVGPRDHFFDLGGNSLTTIQVAMGIRESLGLELPLRTIFESPTVAELASDVERRLIEGADEGALDSLLVELEVTAAGEPRAIPT